MSAVAVLVRRALRNNHRAILGLALIIAIAGGTSLSALSSARRTASAFTRYLSASDASDLAINVNATAYDESVDASLDGTLAIAQRASRLPGIERTSTYIGLESVFLVKASGEFESFGVEVLGSLDGRFLTTDRVALTSGRLPHEEAKDEVLINARAAEETGSQVGSTLHLAVLATSEGDPRAAPVVDRVGVRVVGIGLFPDEVLTDDFDRSARMLVTPATTRAYRDVAGSYYWRALHLAPGSSVDDVIARYQANLPEGYALQVQRTDEQQASVQRAIRPLVTALGIFGLTTAAAAVLLGALGSLRLAGTGGSDVGTLRSLGMRPASTTVTVAAPALAAALLGTIGALVLGGASTRLGTIGSVRAVDPSVGLRVDWLVLLGAGVGLAVCLTVGAGVAAWATVRHRDDETRIKPPSRAADLVARIGLGPSETIGVRHALGGGEVGAGTRVTIAACVLSVVAIVSALTFGAGVQRLLRDPARYGWAADLAVETGGGYEFIDPAGGERAVAASNGAIRALAVTGNGKLHIAKRQINAMGFIPVVGAPPFTVLAGRLPATPDEVALGRVTARSLDASVGDVLGGGGHRLRVVGMVALPAIGPEASSHPSLGQGALLTFEGLASRDDAAYPGVALVTLRDGADVAALAAPITRLVAEHMTELPPEAANGYVELRPGDIVGLGAASTGAYVLAAALVVAAILSAALTLSTSVRRRARTYAVLASIGFDWRAVRRSVRWQIGIVTAAAVVLGLPLGLVVGRMAWRGFADQVGVAGAPVVPVLSLVATTVGFLVAGNLLGLRPARAAVGHSRRTSVLHDP